MSVSDKKAFGYSDLESDRLIKAFRSDGEVCIVLSKKKAAHCKWFLEKLDPVNAKKESEKKVIPRISAMTLSLFKVAALFVFNYPLLHIVAFRFRQRPPYSLRSLPDGQVEILLSKKGSPSTP